MKKFFSMFARLFKPAIAFLILAVLLLALTTTGHAQGFQSRSFLGDGITNVLIVNGALPAGTTVVVATNSYAGYTAATLVIQTGTNIFGTNANFMKAGVGYSNAPAFADVPLWANRDGSVATANISAHIRGVNVAFTNVLTFHFYAVPRGNKLAATGAQNGFTFTMTGNGTNDVLLATNLPTVFCQGSGALRLLDITPSNAGTNGALISCALNGFSPTGQ